MRRSANLWLPCLATILLLPATTTAESPWAAEPVVFSQEPGAATNRRVLDRASYRDLSDEDYQETWQALDDRGFRVTDLDAHVVAGVPYFDAVWIKEAQPTLSFSHRALTLGELDAKVLQYRAQGFRPTKVNAYRLGSQLRFAAVWVRDGRLDFKLERDLTDAQYTARSTVYLAEGYEPVDIASYPGSYRSGNPLRFAGIWLRGAAGTGTRARATPRG